MIERIVLLKLTDEQATPAGRAEVAEVTRERLTGLPGVIGLRVGLPADARSEQSWDVSIVVGFAAVEHVQPYLDHPRHRAYVDEYLRPRLDCIKAWNFEIPV